MVQSVGGNVIRIAAEDEVQAVIRQDPRYHAATRVFSLYPAVASRGIAATADEILNGQCQLDVTIATSTLAVAENAAVYLAPPEKRQHALLFLCEHLFLVISADAVVANMHQAYDKLCSVETPVASQADVAGFGVFISGPSKTADIEQALVIGAQGPRSLTILLIDRYNN
jgi:L-lactate dehydrogenase complex protein LldG